MSPLVVYALSDRDPGVAGLSSVAVAPGLFALVAHADAAPVPSVETARNHDALLRQIAAAADAVLPVRFGTLVDDAPALEKLLAPGAAELLAALEQVRGCEQMTVRVYAAPETETAAETETAPETVAGPGARYLAARMKKLALPAEIVDPLRAAVSDLVRGERAERHATPPLALTLHHLIERGAGERYRTLLQAAETGSRITISGPWPPYAFTPERVT